MLSGMKAVSIDDSKVNLVFVSKLAENIGLSVESFTCPKEAYGHIKGNGQTDVVFVDYMMPEMNGIEFVEQIRTEGYEMPVIMITALADGHEIMLKALESGVSEFLSKPLNAAEFNVRVRNVCKLWQNRLLLENEVASAVQGIRKREHETLQVIGKTAEFKDPETGHHISRVSYYSKIIAESCGMSEDFKEVLFHAAPLHDIGKVGIPDSILLKPGKLSDPEFEIMKTHTTIGYDILANKESPYLTMGSTIALTHHERYNGTGYPYGLTRNAIAVEGRIVAIADVFDALTTRRPYKEPWSFERALAYLQSEKGRHFDPELITHFEMNLDKILNVYNKLRDE
jgi:response regulator RpfG family c-di-GMP phosphodiesterase